MSDQGIDYSRLMPPPAAWSSIPVGQVVVSSLDAGLNCSFLIRRRQFAGLHIHLQRGDDELRHSERSIAGLVRRDEIIFCKAILDMNVIRPLFSDCRLPADVRPLGHSRGT